MARKLRLVEGDTDAAMAAIFSTVIERELQNWVIGLARTLGCLAYHTHNSQRSEPGFPDVVIVRPPDRFPAPWLVLWELKTQTGRLRPAQRVWGTVLTAVARVCPGIDYRVVRPSDRAEIERLLMAGMGEYGHIDKERAA